MVTGNDNSVGYENKQPRPIFQDWQPQYLRDLIQLLSGQHILSKDYNLEQIGTPYLTGPSDFDGHITVVSKWTIKPKVIAVKNDLLLTVKGSGSGTVFKLDIPQAAISRQLMAIRPHSICVVFLYYYLLSLKEELASQALGNLIPGINRKNVLCLQVPLPPLPEQKAIAQSLSDVDALITECDRIITKKRNTKQGTMQQLLTGKKRLPGFSGEWEVKKLGEALKVRHGKSQHDVVDQNGEFPILATGGEIGKSKTYLYDKPSVLIGRKGTIDKPQYIDSPFWTIDTLFYTDILTNAFPKFIFYKFNLIDWYSYNEASGVPSLNAKTIEDIEINLPFLKEQKAIAQILSDMDTEIAGLEQKCDKYKAIKQGMMQELLTGKTRLKYDSNN
jgi:type I restriction enzyme S subunit